MAIAATNSLIAGGSEKGKGVFHGRSAHDKLPNFGGCVTETCFAFANLII